MLTGKRQSSSLITALFLVALSSPTPAISRTAKELLEHCEIALRLPDALGQSTDPIELATMIAQAESCFGHMRGVSTLLSYNCWSRTQGYVPMLAAEAPVSLSAGVEAFVDWVWAAPDSLNEPAVDVIVASLLASFPCTK